MAGNENLGFKNDEIIRVPIDSSFLEQHHFDNIDVKNSSQFHIGHKIEVHINNEGGKNSKIVNGVLKELNPNIRQTSHFRLWPIIILIVIIITIITAIVCVLELGSENLQKEESDTNVNNSKSLNITYSGWNALKIVTRTEWLAEPPRHELNKIHLPVPQVVITHTASEACFTRAKCKFLVRQIQSLHVEGENWWDIGYNFLVGGEGYVYEGRGWDYIGAFARGFNNISIGIAMIGTFVNEKPTDKQFNAVKVLIKEGVLSNKIAKDYRLLAHCNVSETASPGLRIFEEMQKWPHFTENPY